MDIQGAIGALRERSLFAHLPELRRLWLGCAETLEDLANPNPDALPVDDGDIFSIYQLCKDDGVPTVADWLMATYGKRIGAFALEVTDLRDRMIESLR